MTSVVNSTVFTPRLQQRAAAKPVLGYHSSRQLPENWTNIRFHPVQASSLEALHWFGLLRTLPTPIVVQIVVVLVAAWHSQSRTDGYLLVLSFIFQFVFFTALIFWTQLNASHKLWSSYTAIISDQGVARIANGLPCFYMSMEHVTKIEESPHGLFVRGHNRQEVIFIPRGVEDYERLRYRLCKQSLLHPQEHPHLKLAATHMISIAMALLTVLIFLKALDNDNWRVVVIYALALMAVGVWLFVVNFRNPNISLTGKILSVMGFMPAMLLLFKLGFDIVQKLP